MPKNKKGKSKRTSDSSLILMQNDHQLSLSSAGSSIITDPKIIGEKKIEIRPLLGLVRTFQHILVFFETKNIYIYIYIEKIHWTDRLNP